MNEPLKLNDRLRGRLKGESSELGLGSVSVKPGSIKPGSIQPDSSHHWNLGSD